MICMGLLYAENARAKPPVGRPPPPATPPTKPTKPTTPAKPQLPSRPTTKPPSQAKPSRQAKTSWNQDKLEPRQAGAKTGARLGDKTGGNQGCE